VQAPELQHDEEPAQELGAAGAEQILSLLPEAHGAQGNQVNRKSAIANRESKD
jgi:hypothetical protein